MKVSNCKFLAIFVLILLLSGCAIKEYTTPDEFFTLPPTEQQKLCKEWKGILIGQTTDTTYYLTEPWRASNADQLYLSSAQLGNDLRVMIDKKNKKRAAYNISRCAERHYSDEVPEGYSLYYADKNKQTIFLRSDADELNIKATKSVLNGKLDKAVALASQALDIQKNLYSYQIRAYAYALIELKETNGNKKRSLFDSIVKDSSYVINNYNPNGNDYFLRGYAYYFLKKYDKALSDFNFALDNFSKLGGLTENYYYLYETTLYRSRIHCLNNDYEKGLKDASTVNGVFDMYIALLGMVELTEAEQRLSDAIKETEKICNDKTSKKTIAGGSKLRIGAGRVLEYLDHVNFRGY